VTSFSCIRSSSVVRAAYGIIMEATSRNRPKYKAIVQGKLPAYQPMHSPASTLIALLLMAGVLLAAGFCLMSEAEGEG
jgi:hypothetical protein